MTKNNSKQNIFIFLIIFLVVLAIFSVLGYAAITAFFDNKKIKDMETAESQYFGKDSESQYFGETTQPDLMQKGKETEVVVSLTTSPTRILLMQRVIESIMQQTIPPTIIRFNLPRFFKRTNTQYNIPSFITNNPKIKIFWYDEDYGPIMKVLPTIIDYRKNVNVVVIYTDDDVLFLPNTIETHLKFIGKDPNSVYCVSGIFFDKGEWKSPSKKAIISYVDIPEGFMSVAFQSSIFDNVSISLMEYYNLIKNDKVCFGSDDLILGNYFAGNGIKVKKIRVAKLHQELWWDSGCELSYGNSGDGLKDLNVGGHHTAYKTCYNNLIVKGLDFINYVPKKIYTTWHTEKLPANMQKNLEKLKSDNVNFEVLFYNAAQSLAFIKKHFDDSVVNAYLTLIPESFKSDLWRYCVLYVNGGVYVDIKFRCINDFTFEKFIKLRDNVWVKDLGTKDVVTGILCCYPKNPILKKCIEKIVFNVNTNFYGEGVLSPTGPNLLGSFFTQEQMTGMQFKLIKNASEKIVIVDRSGKEILDFYPEYREEQKKEEEKIKKKHYKFLYDNKEIYLKKK